MTIRWEHDFDSVLDGLRCPHDLSPAVGYRLEDYGYVHGLEVETLNWTTEHFLPSIDLSLCQQLFVYSTVWIDMDGRGSLTSVGLSPLRARPSPISTSSFALI